MSSLKIKYIIASVLQFICIIFWFIPACTVVTSFRRNMAGEVVDLYTETNSLADFFENTVFLAVISIIGLLVSLTLLILPVIKSTENKRRRLIYSKISAVYSLFLLLASFFFPYFESTQYYDVGSGFEFGFGGILFIVFNIALFVVLCIISSESKKFKGTVEKAVNYPNPHNHVPQATNASPSNSYTTYAKKDNNSTDNSEVTTHKQQATTLPFQPQGFKFCKQCGNKIVSTAQFCNKCGFKF